MTTIAPQITSLTVVYSTVYSDADQRKHQSSASLAFVWGIHRDRWIPRTKGQLRGKCFHLMTSSCVHHVNDCECDECIGLAWLMEVNYTSCPYQTAPSHNINTLRPRQDGRRFPDDTFERIFFNENVIILIKISLIFLPYGPINNIPVLVQIMAWRRSGDKPLYEPMMGRLPTHICVTRPQWVNQCWHTISGVLWR